MKLKYVLSALLFIVFMIPFVGNVGTADALGNYGCGNPDSKTHVSCLRSKLDSTPYGLKVPKGRDGLGNYRCGGNKTKKQHVNCLRLLLDQHGANLATDGPKGDSGDPCMKTRDPMACMLERAKSVSQQHGVTEGDPKGDSGDPCMKTKDPMTCMIERAKAAARH